MLETKWCRIRQQRLLDQMTERRLDALVVALPHHVYYLAGVMPHWLQHGAFTLFSDGRSRLCSGNKPAENAAADESVSYEASWLSTLRQEQPEVLARQVIDALRVRKSRRIGIDTSPVTAHIALMLARDDNEIEPIDPILWRLRRIKDPDELALMRKAVKCAEAMYRRAREIIEPGIAETEVFAQLNAAAIAEAGEPMTALLGNDYACGVGGGPARPGRLAKSGEIYILDVGPTYRGYFADVCRAVHVDRKPTDAQMIAWNSIVAALQIVERRANPGTSCREIYQEVFDHLRETVDPGMPHHLGHGVGLQPHEYPHLNPRWDDTLIEGEIFTAEPGLYGAALAGGIRLENEYLVTKDGVENLLDSPLELTA